MVERIGDRSGINIPGSKTEKARNRKREVKTSNKVGIQLESRLRNILTESGLNQNKPDLLILSLFETTFVDKQLNFEDKERILAFIKNKISLYPQLVTIFDSLVNELTDNQV